MPEVWTKEFNVSTAARSVGRNAILRCIRPAEKELQGVCIPSDGSFLVWYFLYIILTAFAREWISTPVVGNINIAFILGLLQFATTFLIMWLYERHSSHSLDGPSDALRDKVDKELSK